MNSVELVMKLCISIYDNWIYVLYVDCCSGPESFSSPICPSAEDYNYTIHSPDELKSLYMVSMLHVNLFDCFRCS